LNILTLDAVPSAGALLGTGVTSDIINTINQNLNTGYEFFGSVADIFSNSRQMFVNNIIKPIRDVTVQLAATAAKLIRQDKIRAIVEWDDFAYVPPSMHMSILTFDPIRELHKQGRVDGFGYDPDVVPVEDAYGRLINNGVVEDVLQAINKAGEYEFTWEFDSDDPVLSYEELDHIADTREAILELLNTTSYDPTNYPQHRS